MGSLVSKSRKQSPALLSPQPSQGRLKFDFSDFVKSDEAERMAKRNFGLQGTAMKVSSGDPAKFKEMELKGNVNLRSKEEQGF